MIFISIFFGEDSFITKFEYSKMLYENPRGIGCNKCHGKHGKGMLIAKYKHKSKQKELRTKDITKISYNDFIEVFKKSPPSLMPYYRLTNGELQTLHYYITHKEWWVFIPLYTWQDFINLTFFYKIDTITSYSRGIILINQGWFVFEVNLELY